MKSLYLCFILSFTFGCSSSNSEQNYPEIDGDPNYRSDYSEGAVFFDYKENMDRKEFIQEAKSLEYTDENGAFFKSTARIDSAGNVGMLILEQEQESKIDKDLFYYRNGNKIISLKSLTEFREDKNYYSQSISFYSDSGTILYTGTRKANDLDTLQEKRYLKSKNSVLSDKIPLQILNREGPFQTTFVGTAYSKEQEKSFLVVGATDRSFLATLAIENLDNYFLKKLIRDEKKYFGTPLNIEFTNTAQTDGFTYQKLIDIEAAESAKSLD